MYIVRDKATKKVIHVNPAPVSQGLEGKDIYFQFDPATMEVGRGEFPEVPTHFHIDSRGEIIPWTLQEKVQEGVVTLPPDQKAVGNNIVEKSVSERVAAGIISLKPEEKLVGEQIVQKSLAEKVAEKLITLAPTQVVEGENIREMDDAEKVAAGIIKLDKTQKVLGRFIVPKSRAELAKENLVTLEPDEKVLGEQVVRLTRRQMLDEKRIDLQQYKQQMIEAHTQAALEARRRELPDHELLHAAIGALGPERAAEYKAIVERHLAALNQARVSIAKAVTADAVEAVSASYLPPGGPLPDTSPRLPTDQLPSESIKPGATIDLRTVGTLPSTTGVRTVPTKPTATEVDPPTTRTPATESRTVAPKASVPETRTVAPKAETKPKKK
ncbi:hypothetical protein ACLESO_31545 [Pyxidicoccus sp. 3LG]